MVRYKYEEKGNERKGNQGWSILYMYMKIQQWSLLNLFQEGGQREMMEGMGLIWIHCGYIWSHHNETPFVQQTYPDKIEKFKDSILVR
jgi:hypothetical protein